MSLRYTLFTTTETFKYLHILYIFTHNVGGIGMTTLTLAVPDEMKKKMDSFPEINWSEVARQAFMQKIEDMEFLRKFKEKSKLTESDALRLGKKVSKSVSDRLRKMAR